LLVWKIWKYTPPFEFLFDMYVYRYTYWLPFFCQYKLFETAKYYLIGRRFVWLKNNYILIFIFIFIFIFCCIFTKRRKTNTIALFFIFYCIFTKSSKTNTFFLFFIFSLKQNKKKDIVRNLCQPYLGYRLLRHIKVLDYFQGRKYLNRDI
jgi:hypothetical protein